MKFEDAMYHSVKNNTPMFRATWHFSVCYVEEMGWFMTGYSNECWHPDVDDYTAYDWQVIIDDVLFL